MYQLKHDGGIIRLGDGLNIPIHPGNVDYQLFLEWTAAGNAALPAEPIPPDPITCTAFQIRRALDILGWRGDVEAAVAASGQEMSDAWEFSLEYRPDNLKILQVAAAIGKTTEDIATLFELAVTLQP